MNRLRLGLLQCDVVPDDLRERFDDYPVMFAEAMRKSGIDVDWVVYNLLEGKRPERLDEVEGYITTGSRAAVYDREPWYPDLVELISAINAARIPLVGICFGHQAIADALGGRVEKSHKGWGIGIHGYEVLEPQSWMDPAMERFIVPVCHQDQVVALPPGSRRLAMNAHCENFVVQFSETSLGIQGHPEFEPSYIEALLARRRELLPEDARKIASESLGRQHHNRKVINWIARFIDISRNELRGSR